MEWFDVHVSPTDRALQEAPEVLAAVRVDTAIDVRLGVVNDVVHVVGREALIREVRVGVERGSRFDVLPNDGLKMSLLAASDDGRADLAGAVVAMAIQQSHDGALAKKRIAVRTLEYSLPLAGVHVASLAADVGFIDL